MFRSIIICKICGERREHFGKGKCAKCYQREYQKGKKFREYQNRWRREKYQADPNYKRKTLERNERYCEKHLKEIREYGKEYYTNHHTDSQYRKKRREYVKKRRITDPPYAVMRRVKVLVWQSLKRCIKTGKLPKSTKYGIDCGGIIKKLIQTRPIDESDQKIPFNNLEVHHIKQRSAFNWSNEEQALKGYWHQDNVEWVTKEQHKLIHKIMRKTKRDCMSLRDIEEFYKKK